MGKVRRKHGIYIWLVVMSLAIVSLLEGVGGSDDWSSLCPPGCKCTWVSGKKTGDCRASHWSQIPPGLSPDVQVLEMSSSVLKSLPKDAFKTVDLVNVQKVLLKSCGIERIDREAFRELEIMIELDLSGNRIVSLDMETFTSNVRLRELKLRGNPLSMLTGSQFPPLNYLKLLDMSDCQLSTLPKSAFEMLGVLETLSLAGNRFVRLNEELFRPLSKLKSLSLDRNPWKCDCRLKTFRDWLVERKLFTHDTKCTTPGHVANLAWDVLQSENFACRPEIESVRINGKPTEAFLVHTDIGSDIRLECLVRGNPPPELKWVRDGQVLSNTSRSYGKSYFIHIGEGSDGEGGRAVWVNLTIPRTEAGDAGEYTCVGSNDGGFAEKNLTLNFQDAPSGVGVGLGLGSIGGNGSNDSGWVVIAVTILTVIIGATFAIVLVACMCSRRRRIKTTATSSVKSEVKQNGSTKGPQGNNSGSGGGGQVAVAKLSSPNGRKSCLTMPQGHQSIYSRQTNSSKCTSSTSGVPGGVEVTYRMNPLHSSPQVTTTSTTTPTSSAEHRSSINRRQPKRCTFILPGDSTSSPSSPPSTLVAEYNHQQPSHEMINMNEGTTPYYSPSSVINRNPLHDPNHVLILPPPDEYGSFDPSTGLHQLPSCCSSSLIMQNGDDGSPPVCPYPPPPPPSSSVPHHFQNEEWTSSSPGRSRFANDNLVVSMTQQSPSSSSASSNICATGQQQHFCSSFGGGTLGGGVGTGGRGTGIVPVHSFCPSNSTNGSFHREPSEGIMTKETQTEEKVGGSGLGGSGGVSS